MAGTVDNPAITITSNDRERQPEPWEMAFSNGAAILDEIPVYSRESHVQLAFRDNDEQETKALPKVRLFRLK